MKPTIKPIIKLFILATLVLVCTVSVYAQEEAEEAEPAAAAAPLEFSEPPRLFTIPMANTLRSLDFNLSGSTTFATDRFDFSGTGLIGLGDIAQFEISGLTVMSQLEGEKDKLKTTPAAGVKFYLPGENLYEYLPGLAVSFRRTFGGEEIEQYTVTKEVMVDGEITKQPSKEDFTIKPQLADLYIVATKGFSTENWRGIRAHAGVDIIGSQLFVNDNKLPKSFVVPFGGLEVWATPRAKLMFEYKYLSVFDEEEAAKFVYEKGEDITEKDLESKVDDVIMREWMMMFGVRFFFTQYVTTDVGLRYQGNFESVADTNIEAKLAVSIPTHLIYERVVSQ